MEYKFRKEFEMEGKVLLPKKESQVSDSNVITPGTEFMYTLARKLRSYIRQRIGDSVAWRSIKVIHAWKYADKINLLHNIYTHDIAYNVDLNLQVILSDASSW